MSSRIKVKGRLRPITTLLCNGGVTLLDIKEKGDFVFFTLYGGDTERAKNILFNAGREYTVVKEGGLKTKIRKNVLRVGLYIGLIFGVIASVFYSRAITRVEISGNENVADEDILAVVREDVTFPQDKKTVECDELIKKIISLEGISSASAEIRGNVLKICVLEEPPLPSVSDKTDYTDIISRYDGIITRINVYSGAPCVKKGDTVKKGQTLVSCDVETSEGTFIKEKASGDVYARVWVTEEKVYTPVVMTMERTGRTEKRVRAFGSEDDYDGAFSSYEKVTERIITDAFFPLCFYVTTYYETAEKETEFDFFADEENIVKEETERLEESLPSECVPLRSWYEVKRLDKNVRLVIYYEIEIKIN